MAGSCVLVSNTRPARGPNAARQCKEKFRFLKNYKAFNAFGLFSQFGLKIEKIYFLIRPARPYFESHTARESLWVRDPWFSTYSVCSLILFSCVCLKVLKRRFWSTKPVNVSLDVEKVRGAWVMYELDKRVQATQKLMFIIKRKKSTTHRWDDEKYNKRTKYANQTRGKGRIGYEH